MNNRVAVFRTMAITLNDADFEAAFELMCDERSARRERRMKDNKNNLRVGSLVEWSGNRSGTCTGEVIKIKRKKAIVQQLSGHGKHQGTNWDIPMSMLKVVG